MNNPPSEIEHLQHLVSNLRRDLQNALTQSRRHKDDISELAKLLKECKDRLVTCRFYPETANDPATRKCVEKSKAAIEALEKEGL